MPRDEDVPPLAPRWRPGRPGRPPEGEVQVWLIDLDRPPLPLERLAAHLTPDEAERAARFRFEVHRRRFAAGRGLVREALGRILGRDPAAVPLVYGEKGKPSLDPDAAPREGGGLSFNLSHSANAALLAIALGRDLGVDVEAIRPMPDAGELVERFFAPGERERFRRLAPERRDLVFFCGWTRKEAYVKARGDGLSLPTSAFEVELAPERPPCLLRFDQEPAELERWRFAALEPAAGFVGALAVEAGPGAGGREGSGEATAAGGDEVVGRTWSEAGGEGSGLG